MPRAAALYAGGSAIVGLCWLLTADLTWSRLSTSSFSFLGWWGALVLWGRDGITTACLVASAVVPTAILILAAPLLFCLRWFSGAPAWLTASGSVPGASLAEMVPQAAWIVAYAGACIAIFTVLASLLFLAGTGLFGAFAHPYWQWWLYALSSSHDPVVRLWLVMSGVPAAVLSTVPAGVMLYRRYRRIYGWTPWLAMLPRAVWIVALAGLYFAVFTVLATVLFLLGTGLQNAFAHPFWQWWLYAFYYSDNPVVHTWLGVSGVPAAILPLVAAVSWYRRRRISGWTRRRSPPPERPVAQPIRSTTDNHGHARWALMQEVLLLWPGPNPSFGGVVVGEAYDPRQDRGPFSPGNPATWGQGGRAPLLIDPSIEGSTHSLVVAGSGSFKTTSAVSTLLTWTGSVVVLDPAAELGPMLEAARRGMGHRVFILTPDHAAACGFNVLDWIDTASPLAETDVRAVVE
jgi:hypothetical protein